MADLKIQDATVATVANLTDRIPASQGDVLAKVITVQQIKDVINAVSTTGYTGNIPVTTTNTQLLADRINSLGLVTPTYSFSGTVSVSTGKIRRYFAQAVTIASGIVAIATAPVGVAFTANIVMNGGAVMGTISIPAGQNVGTVTITNPAMVANDYITINITQVGSTTAGADLTIQLLGYFA